MSAAAFHKGFASPVHDAQSVFRTVMLAMSRPGTARRLAMDLPDPGSLAPGAAAVALALCDFETPVWLAPTLAGDEGTVAFLRFHTGAPIVSDTGLARFGFVRHLDELPDLGCFAQGDLAYPDRSTTVVAEVSDIREGRGWRLSGPGTIGDSRFLVDPAPWDFPARLEANHRLFPRGVDFVFVAGERIAALPRSVHVEV